MSKRSSLVPGAVVADGLDDHLATFCETLASAGYARTSKRWKREFVARFILWLRRARIETVRVDESCVSAYLARRGHRPCAHERAAVCQFLEHLRRLGVAPPRLDPEPSPADALMGRYVEHLRNERGLCTRSVEVYSPLVRAFVTALGLGSGADHLASLDASIVREYLLDRAQSRSISYVKLLTAALRSLLRFLFLDGETEADLSTAVPPVRRWRFAAAPAFLTADEVERVIAATDRSTARGRRALAILLLLARLGLRAGEVVALELDDIRWGAGEIIVHGKGRLHDRLPLLKDVGDALALYLREARGQSASRRVFLRLCAPRVGLSGPAAVSKVAREALRRAGLRPAGRVGAHVFRHSLATRMIRRGASLGEIAQVLRHRCLDTTQLYAKVEFDSLRGVALLWPTSEVRR